MKIIQAPRACAILFHLLMSRVQKLTWLLPANICPIVPITFMKARVPFEFVDISAKSLHMDLDQAEGRMKKRDIGGVLYAHTYGEESTPNDFFKFAKSLNPDLLIVDDRCLCPPGFDESSSADVVLYSTGYAKIVELDGGGYAYIKEDVSYQPTPLMYDPARHQEVEQMYKTSIQNHAQFVYRDSDWLETHASLPAWDEYRQQIREGLKSSLTRREDTNRIYRSRLPPDIQLPQEYQTWRFNIRVRNKLQLMNAIFESGLFASSLYASLAGIMSDENAPQAESLAGGVINLFNDHHCTAQMAQRLCDLILRHQS